MRRVRVRVRGRGKVRVGVRARGAHHAHRIVGPYLILVEYGEDQLRRLEACGRLGVEVELERLVPHGAQTLIDDLGRPERALAAGDDDVGVGALLAEEAAVLGDEAAPGNYRDVDLASYHERVRRLCRVGLHILGFASCRLHGGCVAREEDCRSLGVG